MGVILTFLCYDLPWAIAGLRNIVEIISEEGTLNNALSPAGVSMGSTMAPLSTQDVAAQAFAKMMLCSERYRDEAQANWTPGVNGSLLIAPNPDGEPFVGAITDFFSGGGGARTFTDGIDSGGIFHSMASRMANAETVESRVPVLQVYRRELRGRRRAGPLPRRRRRRVRDRAAQAADPPGGAQQRRLGHQRAGRPRPVRRRRPGRRRAASILRGSNLDELFAAGRIPLSAEEVGAREVDVIAAKSFSTIDEGDLLIGVLASGAGFGDPLRRDPHSRRARRRMRVSSREARARSVYGVVLADGELDEPGRSPRASAIRAERLAQGRAARGRRRRRHARGGRVLHPVSDSVEAVEHDGERSLRCSVCHYRYGPYEHDHKRSARMRERPLTDAQPAQLGCAWRSSSLREFYCPGCATALAADVQLREDRSSTRRGSPALGA